MKRREDDMEPRFIQLVMRQQAAGFADVRGALATLVLPVSDRLLNEIVAENLPPAGHVREVQLHAQTGNRIGVRVKLGSPSFLPPLNVTLVIEAQPVLPASPVLVFRLEVGGLLALAGPALRFLDGLPPGIRLEGDRLYVDFAKLLAARGLDSWLAYIEQLNVTTAEGALIVSINAALR
jgi:hypothetical protein